MYDIHMIYTLDPGLTCAVALEAARLPPTTRERRAQLADQLCLFCVRRRCEVTGAAL